MKTTLTIRTTAKTENEEQYKELLFVLTFYVGWATGQGTTTNMTTMDDMVDRTRIQIELNEDLTEAHVTLSVTTSQHVHLEKEWTDGNKIVEAIRNSGLGNFTDPDTGIEIEVTAATKLDTKTFEGKRIFICGNYAPKVYK